MANRFAWLAAAFLALACSAEPRRVEPTAIQAPVQVRLQLARADGGELGRVEVTLRDGSGRVTELRGGETFAGQWTPGGDRKLLLTLLPLERGADPIVHEIAVPDMVPSTWDLGRFEVPAPRVLWVETVDLEGTLLSRAQACVHAGRVGWPARSWFEPERNRMKVEILPKAEGFFVMAKDHETTWIDMPPAGSDEIRVVLARAGALTVSIEGWDADSEQLELWLLGWEPLTHTAGIVDESTARLDDPTHQELLGGDRELRGLRTGVPLRLALRDRRSKPADYARLGNALASLDVAPLAPGEERRVHFVFEPRPRSLKVRVVGPDQLPVEHAIVTFPSAGKGFRTNARGEVEIEPLYGDLVSLWVRTEAHPLRMLRDVPIDSRGVTIVLDAPRNVEVELLRAPGAEHLALRSVAIDPCAGIPLRRALRDDRWSFDRLPPGEVTIVVKTDTGSVRRLHDATNPWATVVVGEPGRIIATCRVEPSLEPNLRAIALAPARTGAATSRSEPGQFDGERERFRLECLELRAYDVWLEEASRDQPSVWTRVGPSRRVVLDLEHPTVEVDLTP